MYSLSSHMSTDDGTDLVQFVPPRPYVVHEDLVGRQLVLDRGLGVVCLL